MGRIRTAALLVLAASSGCGGATKVAAPLPGEIIGRVEISQDVPASSCQVLLEGTPLGAQCDETGTFDIKRVPPGRWDLRIVTDGAVTALPAKRVAAGANSGQVSDLGALRLARPGSVGGHLVNGGGSDLSLAIVAVPEVGAVTAPNANNGFLLDSVSPGVHEVVLITDAGTVIRKNVNVLPGKVTIGADLDLMTIAPNMVTVIGKALRTDAADGGHAGITVELVENLNGTTVQQTTSAADGTFSLQAKAGTYIVRAKDSGNPATAIIPSLVVRGSSDVLLSSSLALPAKNGDLNGNGIPDSIDPDIDGDGVPNAMDAFPYDPSESKDTDGDGVGDRADLRSMGGAGIDHKNMTPDTDGDGKLDFEDNCPLKANPDQKDVDGDGVGDVCDNCPTVPNPDQADSVGNGIGDACRFCKANQDCGSGKICQFGQCVDCIDSAQCGDRVCDVSVGKCVDCSAAHACPGTGHCGATNRCVECIATTDCMPNFACVQSHCEPQCTTSSSCPTGAPFCVQGACQGCRSTVDCTGTNYCDAGTCRPQCTMDANCTGGRTCDTVSHTCVLPCNGMCMNGQACSGGICRTVCDGSRPCGAGLKCDPNGFCIPECVTTADCASKPFTACNAGTCVPTGACKLDGDCPPSQLCVLAGGSGLCTTRPTNPNGMGQYTCAGPCDCKSGEACTGGVCVQDGTPTLFLAATATGDGSGSSPANLSNDPTKISAAKAGTVIAIKGGDTLTVPAAQTLNANNLSIAGGYAVCAANRWVRDGLESSTMISSGAGVLTVPGTSTAPISGASIRGLSLSSTDVATNNYSMITAAHAPSLTVKDVVIRFSDYPSVNGGIYHYGVSCSTCANLDLEDVSTPGFTFTLAESIWFLNLSQVSGKVLRTKTGPVSQFQWWAIYVQTVTGDLVIDGSSIDLYNCNYASTPGSGGIYVGGPTSGTVTITNNQIIDGSFGPWTGILTSALDTLVLGNNLVDGTLITVTNSFAITGISVNDTGQGMLANNTVKYPVNGAGNYTAQGYVIQGPRAGVTLTNSTASGGSTYGLNHVVIGAGGPAITSGPVVIAKSTFSMNSASGPNSALDIAGANFSNLGSVIVTDSNFTMPAAPASSYGLSASNSYVRAERSKFFLGSGTPAYAVNLSNSQLELYDSYLYVAHVSGGSDSGGFLVQTNSSVVGIGNTVDPGGNNVGGNSYGMVCDPTSTMSMTSNIIGGGKSSAGNHIVATGVGLGVSACFTSAASKFVDNYFWYGVSGAMQAGEQVAAASANGSGNLTDTTSITGCQLTTVAQPSYLIDPNSPCVDKGATGTRKDGTAIALDIDGKPRTDAAAMKVDIGCSEAR